MFPAKQDLTICFAHAAYQMQARFELRKTGIRNFQVWNYDDLQKRIPEADIVVVSGMWKNDLIPGAARLKFIQSISSGMDQYSKEQLAARQVRLCSAAGVNARAVAEHAIALMFACCREVARMDRLIRAGTWRTLEGSQLSGKTLGIVGLGGIGLEVARIARGIGMEVIAWNRTRRTDSPVPLVDLDTLLERADVVSLHLSLNDETRGLIDGARLGRLKPGAILVNTARGALIDEAALVEALRSGALRHAGLDVFHDEPLRSDHPLARLDNVTLTAHAGFLTPEASMTLMRRAIDIVRGIVGK